MNSGEKQHGRVGRWVVIGTVVLMILVAGVAWVQATTTDHRYEGATGFQNDCRDDGGTPHAEKPGDTLRLYCEYENGTRRYLNDEE